MQQNILFFNVFSVFQYINLQNYRICNTFAKNVAYAERILQNYSATVMSIFKADSALFQEQAQLAEIHNRDEHEETDEESRRDVLDN